MYQQVVYLYSVICAAAARFRGAGNDDAVHDVSHWHVADCDRARLDPLSALAWLDCADAGVATVRCSQVQNSAQTAW